MPNISRNKSNQSMKLGHLIEYNKGNIFLQSHAENEVGRLVPDLLISGKSKCSATYFQYISIALNLAYNKNKLYKTLDY